MGNGIWCNGLATIMGEIWVCLKIGEKKKTNSYVHMESDDNYIRF